VRLCRACLGRTGPHANPLAVWQATAGPLEPPLDLGGPQRVLASLRDCYGVCSAVELQLLAQHSSPEICSLRAERIPEGLLSLASNSP